MKQEVIFKENASQATHTKFDYTRNITILKGNDGLFYAADANDLHGRQITPTEKELEIYNRHHNPNPIAVKNGWLTFIGVVMIINILLQILIVTKWVF